MLLDNNLYGTAGRGGTSGSGAVFAINTDGTGFTNLHSFTASFTANGWPEPNTDGAWPIGGLILSGSTLYGTTGYGGASGSGVVFAVNTDGSGFALLHNFTGIDGWLAEGSLISTSSALYGTTHYGGSSGNGTVFNISFTPQLTITPSGANAIFTWPTNVAGFDYTGYTLQSTTNLGSRAAWTTVPPAPVVADGQNTVTNAISGTQQFYRLSQ